MTTLKQLKCSGVALCGLIAVSSAQAEAFQDWNVAFKDGKCWAYTFSSNSSNLTGNTQLSVLYAPSDEVAGSISIKTAADDITNWDMSLKVDGKKYDVLFPFAQTAFIGSGQPQKVISNAMRRGRAMEIQWTAPNSQSGTDRFSLMGYTSALKHAESLCR
ncbi:hypothetical protein ACQU0X_27030 [Pseudovibrio ascidiaceicola]|uniref:hypothetical protein n=1 Tax=Pseudovibrio ascidiaceicola TaxID=285279 RepID=UPI003D36D329